MTKKAAGLVDMYDIFGEQILPGNLILYSRGNIKTLQAGIVKNVTIGRITLFDICLKFGPYDYQKQKFEWQKKGIATKFTNCENEDGNRQSHIVIVKDPLFKIENKCIEELIEVMDLLKSEEIIPKNYSLGQTLELVKRNKYKIKES